MVIVPLLTLVFGVDIRYAVGASLLAVIATSSGAAAAFTREGFTHVRLGLLLELATTAGGAGRRLPGRRRQRRPDRDRVRRGADVFRLLCLFWLDPGSGPRAIRFVGARLRLNSSYPTPDGPQAYGVAHVPGGFGLMFVAGVLSGLLGIGSGSIKVLAMDRVMRIPFKVSTTTSNFMIGVTAATSAGVYLHRGYIDPGLAMPIGALRARGLHDRVAVAGAGQGAPPAVAVQRAGCRRGHSNDLQRFARFVLSTATRDSPVERMEIRLNRLVRWSTVVAAVVIALGGIGYLVGHGHDVPHYRAFVGEPAQLRTFQGTLAEAASLDTRGIMQLGLLLLILTPVARVAAALAVFARVRDWLYVCVAPGVLAALGFSLLAS